MVLVWCDHCCLHCVTQQQQLSLRSDKPLILTGLCYWRHVKPSLTDQSCLSDTILSESWVSDESTLLLPWHRQSQERISWAGDILTSTVSVVRSDKEEERSFSVAKVPAEVEAGSMNSVHHLASVERAFSVSRWLPWDTDKVMSFSVEFSVFTCDNQS